MSGMGDLHETIFVVSIALDANTGEVLVEAEAKSGASLVRFNSPRPVWLQHWARTLALIIQERR